MEPGGGTAVGAVESLLTSSCFRKGAESRCRHRVCGAPSSPIWRSEPDGTSVLSPWPESARGRVMMVPPIDVAGLRPRLGDVEAPPKPRSSPSPRVGRGGDRRLRSGRSPSPGVGRSGVRRLLGLSPSPSPGSGGAEFPMVPAAGPDCLSASLCQVAPQSERRRWRCLSVGPVSGAAK
jgi:hypothetical protein